MSTALSATLPVARATGAGAATVAIDVTYQGCAHAGLCYPPITKTLSVTLPPPARRAVARRRQRMPPRVSPRPRPSGALRFGAGPEGQLHPHRQSAAGDCVLFRLRVSLLAMTPCVLPMVPILSGIIAGHGTNVTTMRAFLLSLTYVLGMAFTYTLAGIAVAAAGSHVQAMFQQTWIIVLFSALFVALALSMLGLFTIQMPAAIQTRLSAASNRQTAGSFGGVAVMGALSALIVTTCVAPPLVATFVVIGQSGNIVRGAIALFSLSLGMGAPLLVVGASQGKLLPKAGAWMDTIKQLFGAMMLGVAAWMLARVTPPGLVLLLWAVPAAVAAGILWRGARNIRQAPLLLRTLAAAAGCLRCGADRRLAPRRHGSAGTAAGAELVSTRSWPSTPSNPSATSTARWHRPRPRASRSCSTSMRTGACPARKWRSTPSRTRRFRRHSRTWCCCAPT